MGAPLKLLCLGGAFFFTSELPNQDSHPTCHPERSEAAQRPNGVEGPLLLRISFDCDRGLSPSGGTCFFYPLSTDQFRSLDPFDCREPGRCAVVVNSRLKPVRFDGGNIPTIAGVERRSQLFLTDGVRASIGTIVTEAQYIQRSIVFGHRR